MSSDDGRKTCGIGGWIGGTNVERKEGRMLKRELQKWLEEVKDMEQCAELQVTDIFCAKWSLDSEAN